MTQQLAAYGGPFAYTGQQNASIGARVGAYFVDGLIFGSLSVLLTLIFYGLGPDAIGIVIYLLGSILLAIVYWATLSHGQTPGMKVSGVRLVRVQPGTDIDAGGPGVAVVVGRSIVYTLGSYIIVGPLSPLFDGTGANRGWHDKASGTWMINARTDAALRVFGGAATGAAPHTAPGALPTLSAQPLLPPPPPPPAALATPATAAPSFGAVGVGYVALPAPGVPVLAATEASMETVIAPPRAGINRPVQSPPATLGLVPPLTPPAGPLATPPVAGVISAVPGFAVRVPVPPAPVGPPPAAPFAAPFATPFPAPPSGPDLASERALDEDLDETRAVVPAVALARWALRLDTGEAIDVVGNGFLGRNPAAPDARLAQLVPYPDDTKSISKTHLSFGIDGARLWVMDRRSTNGTLLIRSGQPDVAVDADRPTFMQAGDLLALGDRRIAVETR
ncbi:hypothetical protein E3T55_17160 [Cryobacterium frigoriphilum]|uniref:FHA domain-containing protein n=1 Tax=Cryobacterium frigoriphilum TaxID=1259150 RepID=A0A4R8ZUE1_9MICO|nr:RDD family protein [Cryobacterium frigoriphilum]TFD46342.1 hypothetical protein E3T55_17160 [Cryobacterium frigoriphilum]